ncbi:MAG: succinate dehydrogenase [Burkholderiales bacterium]|nr:succinate dehydrogenase [Burkholderiales bacterium]
MIGPRNHLSYWAFIVHRVSGVALALFLPFHFLALGTALRGEAALGEFLRWSEQPLVVASEWILVVLLAAHLGGGLRLLALEFLPWRHWQRTLAVGAAFFAILAGLVFALAR